MKNVDSSVHGSIPASVMSMAICFPMLRRFLSHMTMRRKENKVPYGVVFGVWGILATCFIERFWDMKAFRGLCDIGLSSDPASCASLSVCRLLSCSRFAKFTCVEILTCVICWMIHLGTNNEREYDPFVWVYIIINKQVQQSYLLPQAHKTSICYPNDWL